MIALSLFLPMFFILPPRKIPPSPMGRIQDMGIQSEKARGMFRRYLPPSILPTSGSSRQVALPSRVRLVSLLASPSHPSPPRAAGTTSDPRGPLLPAPWRGRPGHGHQHARPLYWDPASQHSLAHTTPQTPTPLHAGRTKGRLRTRVVVHRAPDRDRAPPLSWPMAKTPW